MIRFVLVGIIVLLGIFMAICPKYAVKQEERENQESLVRMRKKGIILTIAAFIVIVILVIVQFNM